MVGSRGVWRASWNHLRPARIQMTAEGVWVVFVGGDEDFSSNLPISSATEWLPSDESREYRSNKRNEWAKFGVIRVNHCTCSKFSSMNANVTTMSDVTLATYMTHTLHMLWWFDRKNRLLFLYCDCEIEECSRSSRSVNIVQHVLLPASLLPSYGTRRVIVQFNSICMRIIHS